MRLKQKLFKNLTQSLVLVLSLLWIFHGVAQAAVITGRSITLSNSAGAATSVTYTLGTAALPTSGTPVRSLKIEFCDAASGACVAPTGFTSASSTLAAQPSGLGCGSSWSVDTSDTNELRITHASCAVNPSGTVSVQWNGVTNPTANNTSFYGRITTYSDSAWTTALDSGTVSISTASQVTVSLGVDEVLSFCVYTNANCGAGGTAVNLGTGSTSSTSTGTSKFDAATNATNGYSVSINGSTLTSGGNTITAITAGSGSASSIGSEQFGVNLRDNATPNIGTDPSGAGGYSYGTGYGTVDTFKFVTGNTIVSMSAPTLNTTYTVSYIANIAGTTEPGTYTATLTYICTATF